MMIVLSLAAALTGQTPPSPPSPPEARSETRVFTLGGPGRGRNLDKDGDGTVTREEFTASLYAPFDRLDEDGDGRVEVQAFAGPEGPMDFLLGTAPGTGVQRFQLRRPGARGDGPDDVMVFHSGPEGLTLGDKRIEVIRSGEGGGLSGMDKDGDGRVTEEEFTTPLRDAFRRLDKDGSGVLDESERSGGEVRIVTRRARDE